MHSNLMSSVCTNTFLLPFFVPPSLILFSVRSVFLSISPLFPFFSYFSSFFFPLTFVRLHFPFPSFCRLVQGFNDCMGEWGCHTPSSDAPVRKLLWEDIDNENNTTVWIEARGGSENFYYFAKDLRNF